MMTATRDDVEAGLARLTALLRRELAVRLTDGERITLAAMQAESLHHQVADDALDCREPQALADALEVVLQPH